MHRLDKLYYDRYCEIKNLTLDRISDSFKKEVTEYVYFNTIRIPYSKLEDKDNIVLECHIKSNIKIIDKLKEKLRAYSKKYINTEINQKNLLINQDEITYRLTTNDVLIIYNYISKCSCYKIKPHKKIEGLFARYTFDCCIYPNSNNVYIKNFERELTSYVQNNFLITTPNVRCKIGYSEDNSTFALYFIIKDVVVGPSTMSLIKDNFLEFIKDKFTFDNPIIYPAIERTEEGKKAIHYTVFQYDIYEYEYENLQALFKITNGIL